MPPIILASGESWKAPIALTIVLILVSVAPGLPLALLKLNGTSILHVDGDAGAINPTVVPIGPIRIPLKIGDELDVTNDGTFTIYFA